MRSRYADKLAMVGRCLCDGARMMVGVPNYDVYREHMARTHPDQEPMDYEAFFRNRQGARFGEGNSGGFRCC